MYQSRTKSKRDVEIKVKALAKEKREIKRKAKKQGVSMSKLMIDKTLERGNKNE